MATAASSGFRVIYHEPLCPQCGSSAITTEEVETGDGITETAYLCTACGEAWPLACVTDWDTPARGHPTPSTAWPSPCTAALPGSPGGGAPN